MPMDKGRPCWSSTTTLGTDLEAVLEIARRGMEIEDEMPDRMIGPAPIFGTRGRSNDVILDSKAIYVQDARR